MLMAQFTTVYGTALHLKFQQKSCTETLECPFRDNYSLKTYPKDEGHRGSLFVVIIVILDSSTNHNLPSL